MPIFLVTALINSSLGPRPSQFFWHKMLITMRRPRYKTTCIIINECKLALIMQYNFVSGLHDLHPIFSPKDFLEVLIRVKNPNSVPSVVGGVGEREGEGEGGIEGESQPASGLMKVQMNIQSLFKLVRN